MAEEDALEKHVRKGAAPVIVVDPRAGHGPGIGGFKREHGAFKYGAFAHTRNGNHYGFVEQGVVLSSLKPGLATLYVLMDGSVRMGTWRERDDVKHLRASGQRPQTGDRPGGRAYGTGYCGRLPPHRLACHVR